MMQKRTKFKVYINTWFMQKKILVKESTLSRYTEIINNYIEPYFGYIYVNKIDNAMIIDYLNYLVDDVGLSNKTIRDIFSLLKQILNYANININAKPPKYEKSKIRILNKLEQKKIENYICNNLNFYNIGILLSLYTGIRIGEVCSLRWNSIDFHKKTLTISNTILRIKNLSSNSSKTKVIINKPKSKSSLRTIPIPSQIFALLLKLKDSIKCNDDYILTNNSKYIEPRTYYYHYKKIMDELGLQGYSFHTLRHTFATRCIETGFDYKTLSEILGHSNIKMTLSFYVHPSDEAKINQMEKLKMY